MLLHAMLVHGDVNMMEQIVLIKIVMTIVVIVGLDLIVIEVMLLVDVHSMDMNALQLLVIMIVLRVETQHFVMQVHGDVYMMVLIV